MEYIAYPDKKNWSSILKRPVFDITQLYDQVRPILDRVRMEGDSAVKAYELQFDKVSLDTLSISAEEISKASELLDNSLKESIVLACENISRFHKAQQFESIKVETCPGVYCLQKAVPIEKVGLYVPGGTAPLFSTVLMLAIPAKIAGCKDIVLCTPPNEQGQVHPAILFAAQLTGVTKIFKAGGSQAIAAMAYGTESIPKVDKIFGPGNQYVMAAKQLVSLSDVAIDMPAGPSEVEVLTDDTSNPIFVAADLLSQAEHGVDSQVLMVSTSDDMINAVHKELTRQLEMLPRKELARKSLEHSKFILVHDISEAIAITNEYAPEHLIISTKDYWSIADQITHAGSVFLGQYSCESAGDYASGTNHTLPTKGYAKAYSGLCLDSFVRKITFQELTAEGIREIGPSVVCMAAGEHLDAHKNAMILRLNSLKK